MTSTRHQRPSALLFNPAIRVWSGHAIDRLWASNVLLTLPLVQPGTTLHTPCTWCSNSTAAEGVAMRSVVVKATACIYLHACKCRSSMIVNLVLRLLSCCRLKFRRGCKHTARYTGSLTWMAACYCSTQHRDTCGSCCFVRVALATYHQVLPVGMGYV